MNWNWLIYRCGSIFIIDLFPYSIPILADPLELVTVASATTDEYSTQIQCTEAFFFSKTQTYSENIINTISH